MLGPNWNVLNKFMLAVAMIVLASSNTFAQDDGDDDAQVGGIIISSEGMLTSRGTPANAAMLNKQRFAAAQASLNQELQQTSKLRKVSLNRLEAEISKLIDAGRAIPADMKYLAGMTKITHVFFYPESNDIVIAGPAEGFFFSANNFVVGMETGLATLKLEDLAVALRAHAPNRTKPSVITCSIDPTREGLMRFRDTYIKIKNSGQFKAGMENQVVQAYKNSLGPQQITVGGISPKTDFARVLVEADYRMKLVGMGIEKPAARVTSFVEKANPSSIGKSALQRWFFQPDYECVVFNDDETAMQLTGDGVKLVGEDETVSADGKRQGKGKMNRASKAFCVSFTKNYGKLAKATPIWAELRNVIDMSVAAAFIQKANLYAKADWSLGALGDEQRFPVELYKAPTQVQPIANAYWKNGKFMSPIAGGVQIQARVALNSDRVTIDSKGEINKVRDNVDLSDLSAGQWWWD